MEDVIAAIEHAESRTLIFVSISAALSLLLCVVSCLLYRKDTKRFWHHAVRLPSQIQQPYWYLISVSTGCRPWAGHEGDILLRIVGSRCDGKTFLVNGELYPRLWEADSHLHVYSSGMLLGDLRHVVVVCRPSSRRKRWYLASVQIRLVSDNPERQKTWYFPYHDWIEVFLDPVKVTLTAATDAHDLNRRLMIGWMGRAVSDIHLWTSLFSPLKYTAFGRGERFLCISVEILGSIISCLFVNTVLPLSGPLMLGFYGASCAIIPSSLLEAVLRRIDWRYKILMEDINWYKVVEDGFGKLKRPKTYRQYILKPTHQKMNYGLMFATRNTGIATTKALLKEVLSDDGKFWNWLDPDIPIPEPKAELVENTSSAISVIDAEHKVSLDELGGEEEGEEEDEEYTDDERTWFEKIIPKIKDFFSFNKDGETEDPESGNPGYPPEPVISFITPVHHQTQAESFMPSFFGKESESTVSAQSATSNDLIDMLSLESAEKSETDDEPLEEVKHSTLKMGSGFIVKPISVWKVDSDFSIGSFEMASNKLGDFKTMESMPAADFQGLKNPKLNLRKSHFTPSELKVKMAFSSKRRGGLANIIGNDLQDADSSMDIVVPPELEKLSAEENLLVSWVYHDRCVRGHEWLREGVPLAAAFRRNDDGGIRHKDYYGAELDSYGEYEMDPKRFEKNLRRGSNKEKSALRESCQRCEDPAPKERVFDMLIFPEYADKLEVAFCEMITDPEAWSAMADFLVEWAECVDGPLAYSEAFIIASRLKNGEKIIQDVIACAKPSPIWPILINELTRRLRYQGDNVDRLRQKYGLQNGSTMGNAGKDFGNSYKLGENSIATSQSQNSVFDELQLLLVWRQKLHDQEIPLKACPLKELAEKELKVLNKFYRAMLLTAEGCYLFGELLRQIVMTDDKGKSMVCRLIRHAVAQSDGVPSLVNLVRCVLSAGVEGRNLFTKVFKMVRQRKPNGEKIISKLASAIEKSERGRLLLRDLQIDVSRAHRLSYQVRSEIQRKIGPVVKITKRNFCRLVISLNEVAKIMLRLADNAREVLEKRDRQPDSEEMQKYLKMPTKVQHAKSDHRWVSERICCPRDGYLAQPTLTQNAKPRSKESSVVLSDGVVTPPFVTRLQNQDAETGSLVCPHRRTAGNVQGRKNFATLAVVPKKEGNECHPYNPCYIRKMRTVNEFFLQSKDFERFNMDFKYQKRYQDLETNHHHESNHEVSKCWIPPLSSKRRTAVAVFHGIPGPEKDSCVDWNDRFRGDPDNWENLKLCTCHGKFLGDRENREALALNSHLGKHDCFICDIAAGIDRAENTEDFLDFVAAECEDLPAKRISQLHAVPEVNRDTVREIQRRYNQVRTSDRRENIKNLTNDVTFPVPFPSGYGAHRNTSARNDDRKDFPNCGTPIGNTCECVEGRKVPKSLPKQPKAEPPHVLSSDLPANSEKRPSCACKAKESRQSKPDTASSRRLNSKVVETAPVSVEKHEIQPKMNALQTTTKDYEFPVRSQTSDEKLKHLTRKYDPQYWAADDSDASVFSDPPPNSQYICDECNGVTRYVPNRDAGRADKSISAKDQTACTPEDKAYYLSKRGECQRNCDTESETSSRSSEDKSATQKSSSKESWREAAGCCNSPGCYGLIPRNTRYRRLDANKSSYGDKNNDKSGREYDMRSEAEASQTSTLKYYQSVNARGRLTHPDAKTPLIAKFQHPDNIKGMFDEICDVCKYPTFKCCDDHGNRTAHFDQGYCKCKGAPDLKKTTESLSEALSVTPPHSTCSNCHIQVGTQQKPPAIRYLLPLKIMRCYENALAKFNENPADLTDSGLSLHTAIDIPGDVEEATVNDNEQIVLLDLLGLSGRPTVRKLRRNCKPQVDNQEKDIDVCSDCSSLSSGVCCHVHASRLQPVLHLQGYTCDISGKEKDTKLKPLSFEWWRSHEQAMQSMQACADDCVSLSIVLAKDKNAIRTEHEATCKVCTSTDLHGHCQGGNDLTLRMRFSECLPTVWRSGVCSEGQGETAAVSGKKRPRFYQEIIDVVVKSTKTLLLTPDLRPAHLKHDNPLQQHFQNSSEPGNLDSEESNNDSGAEENAVTLNSAERLSHFRTMMKCLNDIQCQGAMLQGLELVSDKDVTMAALLEKQGSERDEADKISKDSKQTPTFIDLILDFMKKNSCGAVLDCIEVLEAPWELPVDEQMLSARLLKKIDSAISGISQSSGKPVNESTTWEESFQCIIDSFLNEVAFKAMAQRDISQAVEKSCMAQWYMIELADIARLTIARIVRFAELTQAATNNLKGAVKETLCDANSVPGSKSEKTTKRTSSFVFFPNGKEEYSASDDETTNVKRHITALLKRGRDDSRATLDDVLISFERLRRNIHDDLEEAADLVKLTSDLADEETVRLLKKVEPVSHVNQPPQKCVQEHCAEDIVSYHELDTNNNEHCSLSHAAPAKKQNMQPSAGQYQMYSSVSDLRSSLNSSELDAETSDLESATKVSRYLKPSAYGSLKSGTEGSTRAQANIRTFREKIIQQQVLRKMKVTRIGADKGERKLPRHFHDVFKVTSTASIEPEDHTRQALQAEKGRGMLQYIFGEEMNELEMVEAFHGNIKTLVSWKNASIGYYSGVVVRLIVVLSVVCFGIGASLIPLFYSPGDYTVLLSIPVAVLCLILILEPLKCVCVSWIQFIRRIRPAFCNNPVFMKSSPSLMQKSAIFRPVLAEGFKAVQNAEPRRNKPSRVLRDLYERYFKNRASDRMFDRRRRVLPVVVDEDLPISLKHVQSLSNVVEQPGFPPTPEVKKKSDSEKQPSQDVKCKPTYKSEEKKIVDEYIPSADFKSLPESDTSDISRNEEGGFSAQEVKFADTAKIKNIPNLKSERERASSPLPSSKHSDSLSEPGSSIETDSNSTFSGDKGSGSYVQGRQRKHTPIIYCRFSNFPR